MSYVGRRGAAAVSTSFVYELIYVFFSSWHFSYILGPPSSILQRTCYGTATKHRADASSRVAREDDLSGDSLTAFERDEEAEREEAG